MDHTSTAYNAVMDSFAKHVSLAQQHRHALKAARAGKSTAIGAAHSPNKIIQRRRTANTHRHPSQASTVRPLSWHPAATPRHSFDLDTSTSSDHLAYFDAVSSNNNDKQTGSFPYSAYPHQPNQDMPLYSYNPCSKTSSEYSVTTIVPQSTQLLTTASRHDEPVARLEKELVGLGLYDDRPQPPSISLLTSGISLDSPWQPPYSPTLSLASSTTSPFPSPAPQQQHLLHAFDYSLVPADDMVNAYSNFDFDFHYNYNDTLNLQLDQHDAMSGTTAHVDQHLLHNDVKLADGWTASWSVAATDLNSVAYSHNHYQAPAPSAWPQHGNF